MSACDGISIEERTSVRTIVVRIPGRRCQTTACLDIGSVGNVVPVRARLTESRDRHHDDLGVHFPQHGILKVEVAHHPRAIVLQDHVRFSDELKENLPARFVVQVEGYCQLVSVHLVEVGSAIVVVPERVTARIPSSPRCWPVRRLDLDDLRPKICQVPSGKRPCPVCSQFQYSHTGERHALGVLTEGRYLLSVDGVKRSTTRCEFELGVFVESRRRSPDARWRLRKHVWEARHNRSACLGVIDLLEPLTVLKLGRIRQVSGIVHRSNRHSQFLTRPEDLILGLIGAPLGQQRDQLLAVVRPTLTVSEVGTVYQFGTIDQDKECRVPPKWEEPHPAIFARNAVRPRTAKDDPFVSPRGRRPSVC